MIVITIKIAIAITIMIVSMILIMMCINISISTSITTTIISINILVITAPMCCSIARSQFHDSTNTLRRSLTLSYQSSQVQAQTLYAPTHKQYLRTFFMICLISLLEHFSNPSKSTDPCFPN